MEQVCITYSTRLLTAHPIIEEGVAPATERSNLWREREMEEGRIWVYRKRGREEGWEERREGRRVRGRVGGREEEREEKEWKE